MEIRIEDLGFSVITDNIARLQLSLSFGFDSNDFGLGIRNPETDLFEVQDNFRNVLINAV